MSNRVKKVSVKPTAVKETFAPEHLTERARDSGFFQCLKCGHIWFGKPDAYCCPDFCESYPGGPPARPVHVTVLCRECDTGVPLAHFVEHLTSPRFGHTLASMEHQEDKLQ
jgi:hypothetical protein